MQSWTAVFPGSRRRGVELPDEYEICHAARQRGLDRACRASVTHSSSPQPSVCPPVGSSVKAPLQACSTTCRSPSLCRQRWWPTRHWRKSSACRSKWSKERTCTRCCAKGSSDRWGRAGRLSSLRPSRPPSPSEHIGERPRAIDHFRARAQVVGRRRRAATCAGEPRPRRPYAY